MVIWIFLAVITSSFIGVMLGTMTGLLPGIHVNNVALFMLALSGSIVSLLVARGMGEIQAVLVIANVIIATSITHSFVDFIPSTFFGAPDEETALSVLPAHRLLLEGRGHFAVLLSVVGSYTAVAICCALAIPYRYLIGDPYDLYGFLQDNMLVLLLVIVSMMILSERPMGKGLTGKLKGCGAALFLFCLAGVLGLVVLPMGSESPLGLFSSPLFPSLSGLFGLSTLFISLLQKPVIPAQVVENASSFREKFEGTGRPFMHILKGTVAGSIVGFLPGVSASHAAVIAGLGGRLRRRAGEPDGRHGRNRDSQVNKRTEGENGANERRERTVEENGANERRERTVEENGANEGRKRRVGESERAARGSPERAGHDDEGIILTLSAINTSNSFFCLIALFIILRARNGAVLAVQRIIPVVEWGPSGVPEHLLYLLSGVIIASTAALFITVRLGRFFALKMEHIDYGRIVKMIILFVVVMVLAFNGLQGLFVLAVSTSTGLVAPWLGIRRSHAMGFLLLPVIVSLAGVA